MSREAPVLSFFHGRVTTMRQRRFSYSLINKKRKPLRRILVSKARVQSPYLWYELQIYKGMAQTGYTCTH